MFHFKQFSVDQTGCAMKINTDGVLLGAMVVADNPANILDIGTGTGVIALMLAQRYSDTQIDAVEIDLSAAGTAEKNFENSVFKDRLKIYPTSIGDFFNNYLDVQYDIIVSNPPFYMNSLSSPEEKKALAKHTDVSFFEGLMKDISEHLSNPGCCWLIYPFQEATLVSDLVALNHLSLQKLINIHSFAHSDPHRQIACFGREKVFLQQPKQFTIYDAVGVYSAQYKELLQPYFLAF